jgi:hypothetical protein
VLLHLISHLPQKKPFDVVSILPPLNNNPIKIKETLNMCIQELARPEYGIEITKRK